MKLEAKQLTLENIRHGFFTREGGTSEGIYRSLNIGLGSDDSRESVLENRKRVASALEVEEDNLVSPYQIHSPDVICVDRPFKTNDQRQADALVSATPGIAIGIATADCGPVLFADPKARIVGAAHAGWKGALSGILENTISALESLGADRKNVTAVLGPTISQDAYEVGPEFRQRFLENAQDNAQFFKQSKNNNHFMFNLPEYITDKLNTLGVGTVANFSTCTYADEARFYSYRRSTHRKEPDYGRQISAITLI